MTSLSKISFFLIWILLTPRFAWTDTRPVKVCLAGRVMKNLPTYGASFVNAAKLARSLSGIGSKIEIEEHFYDNKPLEPVRTYHSMRDAGCAVIIGYEYLSDLYLVVKEQTDTVIPIFSPYASTNNIEKLPQNIFLFNPAYEFLAKKMFSFLKSRFGKIQNVLIATEISRDSMVEYKTSYVKQFEKHRILFDTFDFLENDQNLKNKILAFITANEKRGKQYQFIFLLAGAVSSANIVNTISHTKATFIGTENFGSSSAQSFYDLLMDKKVSAYFIRNLDLLNPSLRLAKFSQKYFTEFAAKATILGAYAFDAMNMIQDSIKQFHKVSPDTIRSLSFVGITGIRVLSNKYYRSQSYIILSVGPSGYRNEK